MFKAIVHFSIQKKLFVGLTTLFLLLGGIYAMMTLPIDAVPDITNNQVQIVTVSPTLAPQEVEQLITMPIEIAMSNIMNVEEIRSVSRFGLSLVTVVFKESVPTLDARQLINEQIQTVAGEIPTELGTPELMPITTGLGEIYQYVLSVEPGYEEKYDAMELRTIQDWIVKRQLSGIPGIVEINSFGGYLKQYEVAVDPDALYSLNITIGEVFEALNRNNQNTGGSYIEKINKAYYIRSEGMIGKIKDIERIVITNRGRIPIHISDVGSVRFGSAKRFGAMTKDGEGECVGGIAMMLKGANANVVTKELEARVERVQKMLPEGVRVEPYLNRSELVDRNISTVIRNLIEGALIVFIVLIIFLGNVRAGLIVASVIPLAMLFAFILMRVFGVSANLMSLGAIDFGIVVDGSIVILEGMLAHIYSRRLMGRTLSAEEMDREVEAGAGHVARSATFAVLIILIVFFPLLTLTGIEGKYFTPMAKTLVFCIIGALILSLTYVPMMASLFLKRTISSKPTFADRFFGKLNGVYRRTLHFCLRHIWGTIACSFAALAVSLFLFTRLGAEFIPTLDEGDFAMQMTLPAGSSLTHSIELSKQAEETLMKSFPEIKHVVAKIGTAEVPTDPMAVEDADIMIVMKPFKEWTSASSRAEMVEKMKASLEPITGAEFNFSQPIQLRFNELMTGAKADIAIKLYGEDMAELYKKAKEASLFVEQVPGAADVIVEQAMGLPQLVVHYDRAKIARYGMNIEELNTIIRTAYAGEAAGVVFENERRFDLVLRLDNDKVADLNLDKLFVRTAEGIQIPVSEVATIELVNGPLQINRDATKRRIVIGVNVRDADIQKVVRTIQETLDKHIKLEPGYYFEYGGQFENLRNAIDTLTIVIPVALSLILLLLFFAFKSVTYSLVVFSTVPLSLIGGILALWLRGLPFSISAGVGFIALFGVAVLNGILMINHFNNLRKQTKYQMTTNRILAKGCPHLLRPVFLTGLVASLGFVPMAIAKSAGAEVQRPLATVVIGGLIVSTILTLIIIPVFYRLVNSSAAWKRQRWLKRLLPFLLFLGILFPTHAQQTVSLEEAVTIALENHPRLKTATASIERSRASRGESWEVSPTTFNYSWGQINGETRNDNQMEITQSLGSLLTPFYKNALVNRQVATGEYYRDLVKKEITAEVKRAWAYYQYAFHLCALYKEQIEWAGRLRKASQLRYEQGDITLLERNMSSTLVADLQTRLSQAEEELQLATRRFSWTCYSDSPLLPMDTTLVLFPARVAEIAPSDIHLNYFRSVADEKKAMLRIERSRFFPELSVGYVRQKIAPLSGLDSWMVGISFPVLFFPQHSRVRQAKIDSYIARTEAESNIRQLNNKVEELSVALRKEGEHIRYYTTGALPEADALLKSATVQFKENETDITQFVQSLNAAREIRRGYIEAVYAYNISALELELYSR
ncbi:CusA/CzcA family heavy metal efflux RND transporter [Parabacteroides distasonis]|uniref:CusA/CzcA family heavy metal efflux RND transporter n=1 Tax=Parabacteroides distasonis TaxID=823 RepID=UPI0012B170D0|nr:CusA/CzcA family heavy metal efflux RND transporter [Parabacteroides distasonis]MRY15738.1 CusA/CzcA family heavy metal efflux RND transporter [Parabacteroides distasonis]MRY24990.1 CusA/CzcA family heavy metal efflux RND transporter [Parabacteroides distasonis]MRZ70839.1 CusA/CzcA family heavy metal efflux RND transporter [Parabacteroides distasonis]MRZ91198.1 CusA/CzcA family heavy metal efflux RND transporter [Parabacteroides distasonis]